MIDLGLVSGHQRHLKWRWCDAVEAFAMLACGIALAGFTTTVMFDVTSRAIGRPWLWLQEVTTHFFVYGVFFGCAAATRRNDHLYLSAIVETMRGRTRLIFETFSRLAVLAVASCLAIFGYLNFLHGFGSKRMPSLTPEATLTAAIPICGVLVALFCVEQLVNGWRHGFEDPSAGKGERER